MRVGAGILATLCLVFGVAPFLVVPAVVDAARSVTRTRIPDPLVGGWQIGLAGVHGVLAPGLLALGAAHRRDPRRRGSTAAPTRRGSAHRGVGVRPGVPDRPHGVHGHLVR